MATLQKLLPILTAVIAVSLGEVSAAPNLRINADNDIRLLPFSPVCERDTLEIRAQIFNAGTDGETEFNFRIDGKIVHAETIAIKAGEYGFASCHVPMEGKAGRHTVTVNGASVPLKVMKNPKLALDGGFFCLSTYNDRTICRPFLVGLKKMRDNDWRRFVTEMNKIGMKYFIIQAAHQHSGLRPNKQFDDAQWDSFLRANYEGSKLYAKADFAAKDPIAAILDEAEKNGQHVFLPIGNQYGYRGREKDVQELWDRYGKGRYKSLYGWYASSELALHKSDTKEWEAMRERISWCRKVSPVMPVLQSPVLPYEVCDEILESFKTNGFYGADIMMPQDMGCSAHPSKLPKLKAAYAKLVEICKLTGRHLWSNCESFDFISSGPLNNPGENFLMIPRFKYGGMDGACGFKQQMEVAQPYCEKQGTFCLDGFFTPPGFRPKLGGYLAEEQYLDYITILEKGGLD